MNLLSELEGLSGENLCSATLRLLLIRSQDLRDVFVELISRESRSGPITLGSHFSCTLEETTEDSGQWGRLDLLLEMSDALVGIENKLNAGFQENQPHKYLATVAKQAKALSDMRGRVFQPIVAVLAPKSRHQEVYDLIQNNESFLVLDWEEVLDVLASASLNIDSATNVLLSALCSYVRQQITLFPEWSKWLPHLRRKFSAGGTPLQMEVVRKAWQFFPESGGRLSNGDSWCGYYFTDRREGRSGWYGFVPNKELVKGAKHEVEFIVATSFPVTLSEQDFREVVLKAGAGFIGAEQIYSWAVNLEGSWAQPDHWRERLLPLNEAYRKVKTDTGNERTG